VGSLVYARRVIAYGAIAFFIGISRPADAREAFPCDIGKAQMFRAAGDRYRADARYADAAHWYLAAARETGQCRLASASLLGARALAAAGAALALNGEYLRALALLHDAQTRLVALEPHTDELAAELQRVRDLIGAVIDAVNTVARLSM
jgi:hypothetical protein